MDIKQEQDRFSDLFQEFVETEPEIGCMGQTKQNKLKTFKNKHAFEPERIKQFAPVDTMKGDIEYEILKVVRFTEDTISEKAQILTKSNKQEFEETSNVKIMDTNDIKQELDEYIQTKTEGEVRELLTSHCDLPTLKIENTDNSDSGCRYNSKPFKCDICSKGFKYNSDLQHHLIIHSGEKPFKCDICSKGFNRKPHLERHLIIHSGEKPFKCDICSYEFNLKYHLKRHLITHSGEKPFKCDICSKEFTQNGSLKQHLITHSIEKPFKCDICSKGFNLKSILQKHLIIHSETKPFKCDICCKEFTQKSTLQKHLINHSSGKSGGSLTHDKNVHLLTNESTACFYMLLPM